MKNKKSLGGLFFRLRKDLYFPFNVHLSHYLATLSHADILVSWNFKHIVNIDRIRGYNSVNLKLGYKMIEIYSLLELVFNCVS